MNKSRVRFTALVLVALSAITVAGCRGRIPSFRIPRIPAAPKVRVPEFKQVQINPVPRPFNPRVRIPEGVVARFPRSVPRPILPGLPARPPIFRAAPPAEEAGALKRVSPHLEEIGQLGRNQEWDKLSQPVQEALRTPNLPPELQETLGGVDRQASRMQSIEELETVLGTGKVDPARVDSLKKNLAHLREATGDHELARSVENYLALKAELAGCPKVARKLLPAGQREVDAARRFRDLKTSLLGEGQARPAHPEAADWWSQHLIPEPKAGGPRVWVKESALKDLPSLKKELQAADKVLRARLKTRIKAKATAPRYYLGQNLARLQHYSRLGKKGQEDEKKKVRAQWREQPAAAVARLLGRPLTPAEKVLVPRMLRQGEQSAGIARIFRELDRAAAKP
jgi:hypothetical protein